MSKPNAALAVLATLVLCGAQADAAAILTGEIQLRLGGSAQLVGHNQYEAEAGTLVSLEMKWTPKDEIWLFAVADDQWGEADYSNILTIFAGSNAEGHVLAFFHVTAELAGKKFHLQAVAIDQKGEYYGSEMVDVTIPGVQILLPPNDRARSGEKKARE